MTPAIHQFIPALIPRDAVGNHTLALRDVLRAQGWDSEIFAEATHAELAGESRTLDSYDQIANESDVLIYQFATSSRTASYLNERSERLVIQYHNITNPELYLPWDPQAADRSVLARNELRTLANRAVLGLGVSEYNRRDLERTGYRRTDVAPVLFDAARPRAEPDEATAERLAADKRVGGIDVLFVGRIVPPKGHDDLLKVLWALKRCQSMRVRLHLVGSFPSREYLRGLREFALELGVGDAVRFCGDVDDAVLAAYWTAADVYLSASRHEGFGIPFVEAFIARVPIVAVASGAVSETVGNAGLLLSRFEPAPMALATERVITDDQLRTLLVARGEETVRALSAHAVTRTLDALAPVLP